MFHVTLNGKPSAKTKVKVVIGQCIYEANKFNDKFSTPRSFYFNRPDFRYENHSKLRYKCYGHKG